MGVRCFGRTCWLTAAGHEVSNGVRDFRAFDLHSEHVHSPCLADRPSRALELLRLCEDFCGLRGLLSVFFATSAGRLLMVGAPVSSLNGFAPAFDSNDESPLFSVATV